MKNKLKNKKGLTYLELMAVMVILSIISVFAYNYFSSFDEEAELSARQLQSKTLTDVVSEYLYMTGSPPLVNEGEDYISEPAPIDLNKIRADLNGDIEGRYYVYGPNALVYYDYPEEYIYKVFIKYVNEHNDFPLISGSEDKSYIDVKKLYEEGYLKYPPQTSYMFNEGFEFSDQATINDKTNYLKSKNVTQVPLQQDISQPAEANTPSKPIIIPNKSGPYYEGQVIEFSAQSYYKKGDLEYRWNSSSIPSKTYTRTLTIGTHTITVRSYAKDGTVSNIGSFTFEVQGENQRPSKPVISVSPSQPTYTSNEAVTITAVSSDPDVGDTITYKWVGKSPNDRYKRGSHLITVYAIDNNGNISEKSSVTINVSNSPPEVTSVLSNPNPIYLDSVVTFTPIVSDPDDDIVEYEIISGLSNDRKYPIGNHNLQIRAKDQLGAEIIYTHTFTVQNRVPTVPTLSMSPDSNLNNTTDITFTASGSIDPDGHTITYEWDNRQTNYPVGTHIVRVRAVDELGGASEWASVTFYVDMKPGIIAHYQFNNNANDSSEYGNNGTVINTGGGYTSGVDSYGRINSVISYVSVNSNYTLLPKNGITMEAWVKPSSTNATKMIVNKGNSWGMAIKNNELMAFIESDKPGTWSWINSTKIVPLNTWSHVAVTYDKNNVKFYINGRLVHTDNSTETGIINPTDTNRPLYIGASANDGGISSYFTGTIDEVKIYNIPLTSTEILDSYNNFQYFSHTINNISILYWETATRSSPILQDEFCYVTLNTNNYAIPSTDSYLQYDIYQDPNNDSFKTGIDLLFTDGTRLSQNSTLVDPLGLPAHPSTNLETQTSGKWYKRTIDLRGYYGKTIDAVLLGNEQENGDTMVRVANVRIIFNGNSSLNISNQVPSVSTFKSDNHNILYTKFIDDSLDKGHIAYYDFISNNMYNSLNFKNYSLNGATMVNSILGKGVAIQGQQISVPITDLAVEDTNYVTVAFWMLYNGSTGSMPIGFDKFNYYCSNTGNCGFNTGGGDTVGISDPYSLTNFVHTVLVFNKNDSANGSIYINGVKQNVNHLEGTILNDFAVFENSFNISGWGSNSFSGYRLNGVTIDEVNIWNRKLTDAEVTSFYNPYLTISFNNKPNQPSFNASPFIRYSDTYVTFTPGTLTDPDVGDIITRLEWSVNGGNWEPYPPNGYFSPGTHYIKIRGRDSRGAYSNSYSSLGLVVNNSLPTQPSFTYNPSSNIKDNTDITFTRTDSTDIDGDTITYEWRVDNGIWTTTEPNGKMTVGTHTIELRAKDSRGGYSTTYSRSITVTSSFIPVTVSYLHTGAQQTYTIPYTGWWKLQVWGAKGGANQICYACYPGGNGGYAYGEMLLDAGTTLYIYVGGMGSDTNSNPNFINRWNSGGWNGGGRGTGSAGPGGGGATDIRIGGTTDSHRIIVAGGGGGGRDMGSFHGGNGINLTTTSSGGSGCYGYWSSTGNPADNGGGGGGYLGGSGSCSDDGIGGYGGSNFVGTLTNSGTLNGENNGYGIAVITRINR